jgi:hypothetical protein
MSDMLSYRRPGVAGRPRDLAITDFRFAERPDTVLAGRNGHCYLLYASGSSARAARPRLVARARATPARRLVECVLYVFSGGCAAAAVWFGFIVPIDPMPAVTPDYTDVASRSSISSAYCTMVPSSCGLTRR